MNKNQFIYTLSNSLGNIRKEDKDEILYDYEEHFAIGAESGKTEEEIAQSLGDPRIIAKQFKAECALRQAESSKSVGNIIGAVFAAGGLGFFNLVFVLGPFMGIVGTLIGLFAAAIGILVSGVAFFVAVILSPIFPWLINVTINPAFVIFISLGLTSFGALFLIGDLYLAKLLYKVTIKYLKFNISIVRNRTSSSI